METTKYTTNSNKSSKPVIKDNPQFKKTVKTLKQLRTLVRDCYIFGYRSRKDFSKLGFSGRSYDDYRRKLENCLDYHYFEQPNTKTRQLRLKSDIYHHSYNYLIDTFYVSTITNNFYTLLVTLQVLSSASNPLTKNECWDKLAELYPDYSETIEWNTSTLNRVLDELVDYGWVRKSARKNNDEFRLADSFLDELTLSEIRELYNAVNFYKNVSFLISPGYFFTQTLENHTLSKYGEELTKKDLFQYRHHNLSRLMDDQQLLTVMKAIKDGKLLTYKKSSGKESHTIFPSYVKTTYPYNRQSIVSNNGNEVSIYTLESLEIKKVSSVSELPPKRKPRHCLELIFTFQDTDDEKEAIHIKNRILSEASWMNCTSMTDERWTYTANVSDPLQYVPWIRTFHKFVSLGAGTYPGLISKLNTDRTEALRNYGII